MQQKIKLYLRSNKSCKYVDYIAFSHGNDLYHIECIINDKEYQSSNLRHNDQKSMIDIDEDLFHGISVDIIKNHTKCIPVKNNVTDEKFELNPYLNNLKENNLISIPLKDTRHFKLPLKKLFDLSLIHISEPTRL